MKASVIRLKAEATISRISWPWAVPAILGLLYTPAIRATFGFYDDYDALWRSGAEPDWLVEVTVSYGRPLQGVLLQAGLSLTDSISALRWSRLGGAIAVIGAGLVTYVAAQRARFQPAASTDAIDESGVMPRPPERRARGDP